MAKETAGAAKVPIKNPFTAKTAVLSGAKRSITDLHKPNRNPIAPMSKSTVLALNDQSYKAGLLAGKRAAAGHGRKKRGWDNPIGVDDALDLAKVGALGAATKIGVDLAAGQILPKLNISKAQNSNVYYMSKLIGAVIVGELLSDATKGASYTGAGGALAAYMAEWGESMLAQKLPASMPLGSPLPVMRLVNPPNITMAGAGLAGYGDSKNVVLQPTPAQQPVKNPCGCGGQSGMNLAGVGRGVGTGESDVMNGVVKSADTTPRLFGGVKRRR